MTTIIPRRSMVGNYGHAKRGVPIEVDEATAKRLVENGRADLASGEVVETRGRRAGKVEKAKAAGGAGAGNPTKPRRSGGRTGAGKQSPASPEGQAQETQTSISSEGQAQD